MPKPIKKRADKKSRQQEDINSNYEKVLSFYENNQTNIAIAAGVFICIVMLLVGITLYKRSVSKKADILSYEAYRSFYNLNTKENLSDEARYKAALEKFKKSYQHKKSAVTLFYIANCYFELENLTDAEKSLLKIRKEFSSDNDIIPISHFRLYQLYKKKGEEEKAAKTLNELIALKSPIYKDVAIMAQSNKLLEEGKQDEVIKELNKIIKNYPGSPFSKEAASKIETIKNIEAKKEEPVEDKDKPETDKKPSLSNEVKSE